MAIQKLHIDHFITISNTCIMLDVRSPAEYLYAHIPGAFSMPIFTDEERKVIGIAYKQKGRQPAIKIGLEYFGVKMRSIVEKVEALVAEKHHLYENKALIVYCWRGGMRSAGMAWLLDLYGFHICLLEGGYKAFRKWTHRQFEKAYSMCILGGYTGSGKTQLLHALVAQNQQTIDLEQLANHRGSAFGKIGTTPQPSQEMFENLLGLTLFIKTQRCVNGDQSMLWIEDESMRIGNLTIPMGVWKQMRKSVVFFLQVPFEERLALLVKAYGKGAKEALIASVNRIKKRLGGAEAACAIQYLAEDKIELAFRILLVYYDKWYEKGLQKRSIASCYSINISYEFESLQNIVDKLIDCKTAANDT